MRATLEGNPEVVLRMSTTDAAHLRAVLGALRGGVEAADVGFRVYNTLLSVDLPKVPRMQVTSDGVLREHVFQG